MSCRASSKLVSRSIFLKLRDARSLRLAQMIDVVYYLNVGAAAVVLADEATEVLSSEMIDFVDHLAELLAEEFVRATKEASDEGSGVREGLERESAGAEHRGSDPSL